MKNENAIYQAKAGSNIALIKYWGKKDPKAQIPANSSLSMTLDSLHTETRACINDKSDHEVFINGTYYPRSDATGKKAYSFLDFLSAQQNFSKNLSIHSKNSFPMGCGIASSASGMAALCLAALGAITNSSEHSREEICQLAKMGSGSACRSLHGGFVMWEPQRVVQVHDQPYWPLCDLVLLVDSAPKTTSSSAGHLRAQTSPLFRIRQSVLPERIAATLDALERKNIDQLGCIIEAEAIEMHAVMLTSEPSLWYLTEQSIAIIEWLRALRANTGLPVYFTIDAGPNIHLIFEPAYTNDLKRALAQSFPQIEYILDRTGPAASLTRV